MGDTASFVQFPHPGGEHRPARDLMPWNTGMHKRKFLVGSAHYFDGEQSRQGEVAFWGEWEPPSLVERRWLAEGELPRVLHRPYWAQSAPETASNTDPWVFGEHMLYSNCKQVAGDPPRPTGMQELLPGSVICFGSTIQGQFCVDTVFVVASRHRWRPGRPSAADLDEAFLQCTAGPLSTWSDNACGRGPDIEFTLYRGATATNPVHGMYSFVPAQPMSLTDPRFARPVVSLPGLINPASRQSVRGVRDSLPVAVVRRAWESLRDQVLAQILALATFLETPRQVRVRDSA